MTGKQAIEFPKPQVLPSKILMVIRENVSEKLLDLCCLSFVNAQLVDPGTQQDHLQ